MSAHTTSPAESAAVDANTPTISGASASPATGLRKVGDAIAVTNDADGDDARDGATDSGMVAGMAVASSVNGTGGMDSYWN